MASKGLKQVLMLLAGLGGTSINTVSHVVCGIVVISTFSASLNAAQVAVAVARANSGKARHKVSSKPKTEG